MSSNYILFDSTNTLITSQNGAGLATLAYLNAVIEIFSNKRIDVLIPSEICNDNWNFNPIKVSPRLLPAKVLGMFQGKFYRSPDFILNHIQKNPNKYEWLFLNSGLNSGYIIEHLQNKNLKTVVLHHNFESEYMMDSRNIITLYGRTSYWVKKWERKAYFGATINLFLTNQDKELFEEEYGERANNYVLGMFEPYSSEKPKLVDSDEKSAAITCSLGSPQNVFALRRFKDTYLELFNQTLPEWKLKLMGRNPEADILEWPQQYPFVEVYPNPKNIRDLCAKSSIYFCQMDAGGGLKLRVMDGLRNGQPILVHKVSARGYDAFFNEPFFKIYDDEKSFVKALKELSLYIQSEHFSRQYIQYKYYSEFGFDSGTSRLKMILENFQKQLE